MSIEEGYIRYACDRSEKVHENGEKPIEFLTPDDKRSNEWHQIVHRDKNGVETKYTLCEACFKKYQSVEQTWQNDFAEFIDEGIY